MFDPYYCPDRPLEPPVPRTVCKCPVCNQDIEEGHDIAEYDGEKYHSECFDGIVVSLLHDKGAKETTITEGVCPLCGEPFSSDDCDAVTYKGKTYHRDCFEDHADGFIADAGARFHEIAVYRPDIDNPFYEVAVGGDW